MNDRELRQLRNESGRERVEAARLLSRRRAERLADRMTSRQSTLGPRIRVTRTGR